MEGYSLSMSRRPESPGAENLLFTEIPVLNLGYVQPIDYMGTDIDIVQAARVSYGPSTRKLHDDRGLLRYLMRHQHTTPFEMCEVKFRCKMPIFVARQWIRHRTANVNEMSLRYTEAPDEFYMPVLEDISLQSTNNKQGREEAPLSPDKAAEIQKLLEDAHTSSYEIYEKLVSEFGIARELSRAILPVSLYTQWIWKIDLKNLFHFLGLRLDAHAQIEIRRFAEAMATFVQAWVPLAWEAFQDYHQLSMTLSRHEVEALGEILAGTPVEDISSLRGRERAEFLAKLARLQEVPVTHTQER